LPAVIESARPRSALTVGSFDGVHLGHQAILRALVRRAHAAGLPSVVVTFEPHPMAVLRPGTGPALLTDRAEKTVRLAALGVDRVHVLRFTPEFARIEPEAFVRDLLVGELGCRQLVVGEDHRFGHARAGGMAELRKLADDFALGLEVVPPVRVEGAPASSTRTRNAIAQADLLLAEKLLGRPYGVFAPVVRGEGRGVALGVPTVNLPVDPRKQMPPAGIYACRIEIEGRLYAAAAHWGPRPTFADERPVLEAHVLGWEGDLYGAWLELGFLERLRGIVAFGTAEELARAMEEDLRRAAEVAGGGSALQVGESR
jgi:riboflavin kinase/FMN adenylyltransferase